MTLKVSAYAIPDDSVTETVTKSVSDFSRRKKLILEKQWSAKGLPSTYTFALRSRYAIGVESYRLVSSS